MSNKNKIRDLLLSSIECSVRSKVPVLYISNPGLSKTTTVMRWAERAGYHVVSLIGSAYDRSELMGYMVNTGKDYLEIMKPNWFAEIEEYSEKGTPTVLFIDEISTAPIDVQGSLYRLIFERCDGKGRKLPEDCVIFSAANYKWNLPPAFQITAPALNRFCIVNVNVGSMQAMLDEALQSREEQDEDLPVFKANPKYNLSEKEVKDLVHSKLSELCLSFSDKNSSSGFLNPSNKALDELYDASYVPDNNVLNFFSFRTLEYLCRMCEACVKYRIKSRDWIETMTDGLIGAGTGNFEGAQLTAWRKAAKATVKSIILELSNLSKVDGLEEDEIEEPFKKAKSLPEKVQALSLILDEASSLKKDFVTQKITEIAALIYEKYPYQGEDMLKILSGIAGEDKKDNSVNIANFKADMEAIHDFVELLSNSTFSHEELLKIAVNADVSYRTYEFYMKTAA